MNAPDQASHNVERAKILEFFTLVAELLDFDIPTIKRLFEGPWEQEAEKMATMYSQSYIKKKDGTTSSGESLPNYNHLSLNQQSRFFDDDSVTHQDPFR